MNEAAQALNNNNNNNNNTIGVTLIASNSNGGDSNGDDGEVPTNNYADDAMVEDDETQTVQLKTLNGSLIRMTPQEACQTFHVCFHTYG
jgi:hypothetical protein